MNFLAHCLLAAPEEGLIAGGVLGDFIKGPVPDDLPAELGAGIRLHRRIDSFSNHLPEMKVSVRRFGPDLRRAAPVLLDIVADRILAETWQHYCDRSIGDFTSDVYTALTRYDHHVPASGRRFVDYMVATDLLARYGEPEPLGRAAGHVLERLRMTHLAELFATAMDEQWASLTADFHVYFPRLQEFAAEEKHVIASSSP